MRKHAHVNFQFLLFVVLGLGLVQNAICQTTSFTNGYGDQQYDNPLNWDNGLPVDGGLAVVPTGFSAVLNLTEDISTSYDLVIEGILEINPSSYNWNIISSLTVSGQLNNSSALQLDGLVTLTGSMTNFKLVELSGETNSSAAITNAGTIYINDGAIVNSSGYVLQFGSAKIYIDGTWDNMPGGILETYSDIYILGKLDNHGVLTNADTIVNEGKLVNYSLFNNNAILINKDSLINTGTMFSTLITENTGFWLNEGSLDRNGTHSNAGQMVNTGIQRIVSGSFNNLIGGSVVNEGVLEHFGVFNNAGSLVNATCATLQAKQGSTITTTGAGQTINNGVLYHLAGATIGSVEQNGLVITDPFGIAAPIALCNSSLIRTLDANNEVHLTVDDIDNGSSASYCPPLARSISLTDFTCLEVGNQLVTMTLTDGKGVQSSCFSTLQIIDPTPPVLVCPADITVNIPTGQCEAMVDFLVSVIDNCSSLTALPTNPGSAISGSMFPAGTTELSYYVVTEAGPIACSFQIEVLSADASQPLSCKPLVSITLDASCEQFITPTDILLAAYGCPDQFAISINDIPNYAYVNGGNINMPLTGTLHYNGGDSCNFAIVVNDAQAPVLTCMPITIPCTTNPDFVNLPAAIDCAQGLTFAFSDAPVLDFACNNGIVASVTRTYTVTDPSGNTASCNQVISFSNGFEGQLLAPEPIVISCQSPYQSDINGHPAPTSYASAILGSVGSPSLAGVPLSGGLYDGYCQFTLEYADVENVGTCIGTKEISRNWIVTNVCTGLVWSGTQLITVQDDIAPSIVCPGATPRPTNDGCTHTGFLPIPNASDVCGGGLTFFAWDDAGYVSDFKIYNGPVGDHIVYWSATDGCGNSASCQFILYVVDESLPTIVAPDTFFALSYNLVVEDLYSDVQDACSPVTVGFWPLGDVSLPVTTYQATNTLTTLWVVVQALDSAGNMALDTVLVVFDLQIEPASLECPENDFITTDDITNIVDLNAFFGDPILINPSNDNVSPISIVILPYYDDCHGGEIIRIFSANDFTTGLPLYCVHKIFIEAIPNAVVTFPADQLIGADCQDLADLNNPIIVGVDAVATYSDSIATGLCPVLYRTWVVIDTCVYKPGYSSYTALGNDLGNNTWSDDGDGYFEYVQKIEISDSEPPVVTANCGTTIVASDASCAATFNLTVGITDNCSENVNCAISFPDFPIFSGNTTSQQGQVFYEVTLPVGTFLADLTLTDACGNASICSATITVTQGDCPQGLMAAYNGQLVDVGFEALAQIPVSVKNTQGTVVAYETTDANGHFVAENLLLTENYTATPQWSQTKPAGLNVFDLYAVWQGYSNIGEPLYGLAYDANNDDQLDNQDFSYLTDVLLGKSTMPTWALINPDLTVVNQTTPWSAPNPSFWQIDAGNTETLVAWLPGDINANAFEPELPEVTQKLQLALPTIWTPGQIYSIKITSPATWNALQTTLQWPANEATFISIEGIGIDINNDQIAVTNNGLQIVWAGEPAIDNPTLFNLYFQAGQSMPHFAQSTADDQTHLGLVDAQPVQIQWDILPSGSEENSQPIIYPNPSSQDITVVLNITKAGDADFRIADLTGRTIFSWKYPSDIGMQKFVLPASLLPAGYYMLFINQGYDEWIEPIERY
jgi:hypothetical protein